MILRPRQAAFTIRVVYLAAGAGLLYFIPPCPTVKEFVGTLKDRPPVLTNRKAIDRIGAFLDAKGLDLPDEPPDGMMVYQAGERLRFAFVHGGRVCGFIDGPLSAAKAILKLIEPAQSI